LLVVSEQTDGEGGSPVVTTYLVVGPRRVLVRVDASRAVGRPAVAALWSCGRLDPSVRPPRTSRCVPGWPAARNGSMVSSMRRRIDTPPRNVGARCANRTDPAPPNTGPALFLSGVGPQRRLALLHSLQERRLPTGTADRNTRSPPTSRPFARRRARPVVLPCL